MVKEIRMLNECPAVSFTLKAPQEKAIKSTQKIKEPKNTRAAHKKYHLLLLFFSSLRILCFSFSDWPKLFSFGFSPAGSGPK